MTLIEAAARRTGVALPAMILCALVCMFVVTAVVALTVFLVRRNRSR